jgi:hypothetical protein
MRGVKVGKWGETTERRVAKALEMARATLRELLHVENPPGSEIIFVVLKMAVDIHRREKAVGPSMGGYKALWPDYTHDTEERLAALKQRMIDLAAGDPPDVVFGLTKTTTPAELALMDAVNEVFKSCLVGKNQTRDWKLLNALAYGKPSRAVAKTLHLSHRIVLDYKQMQCAAIWTKVKHLMPVEVEGATVWQNEAL